MVFLSHHPGNFSISDIHLILLLESMPNLSRLPIAFAPVLYSENFSLGVNMGRTNFNIALKLLQTVLTVYQCQNFLAHINSFHFECNLTFGFYLHLLCFCNFSEFNLFCPAVVTAAVISTCTPNLNNQPVDVMVFFSSFFPSISPHHQ